MCLFDIVYYYYILYYSDLWSPLSFILCCLDVKYTVWSVMSLIVHQLIGVVKFFPVTALRVMDTPVMTLRTVSFLFLSALHLLPLSNTSALLSNTRELLRLIIKHPWTPPPYCQTPVNSSALLSNIRELLRIIVKHPWTPPPYCQTPVNSSALLSNTRELLRLIVKHTKKSSHKPSVSFVKHPKTVHINPLLPS